MPVFVILGIAYNEEIPLGGLLDNSPALKITLLIRLLILIGVLTGIVIFILQVVKNRNTKIKEVLPSVQELEGQVINGSIAGPFEKAWNIFVLTSGILLNAFFMAFSIPMLMQLVGGDMVGIGKLFASVALLFILCGGACGIVIIIRSGLKQSRWEKSIQTTSQNSSAEKVKWLLVRQLLQKVCLCPVLFSIIVFRDYFYYEQLLGKLSLVYLLYFQIILSVSGLIAVVRLVKSGQISILRAAVSSILLLFPVFDLLSMRLLYKKAEISLLS